MEEQSTLFACQKMSSKAYQIIKDPLFSTLGKKEQLSSRIKPSFDEFLSLFINLS